MSASSGPRWPELPSRSDRRIAADAQDELEGWIEERTLDLTRHGVAPDEARRLARAEFGDLSETHRRVVADDIAVQRTLRVTRWGSELAADARAALRFARRTPLATAVLISTFALGIGATTAIYSVVHPILVRALPYAAEGSLVQLASTDKGELSAGREVSAHAFLTLREQAHTLAGVAGLGGWDTSLIGDGDPEAVDGARLTADFFTVLGVRPAAGRLFAAGDDAPGAEPIVVLGDRLWRRRFAADARVVGKKINTNGTLRRVVGVAQPGFFIPTQPTAELYIPMDLAPVLKDPSRARRFRFVRLFARVKEGTTRESAQRDVDAVLGRLASEDGASYSGLGARVIMMREAVSGRMRPALLALMGSALTLLLIACANITVVLLTRTMSREHELAVRAALGAGRGRLARQLLVESLTLASLGGVAGTLLALLLMRLLSTIGTSFLPPGTILSLNGPVLAVALALTLASGFAFGLAPALVGGRDLGGILAALTTRASSTRARTTLRSVLVGGQLALSVALLLVASLLGRSLNRLAALDLGYRTERVLAFDVGLPGARYKSEADEDRFWEALMPRLRVIPGVIAVGTAGNVPLGGSSGASLAIEGHAPPSDGRLPEVRYATVSDDFFRTLGIPLLQGRPFSNTDRAGAPGVAIINARAARAYWGNTNPIGARIRLGPNPDRPWIEVVGVVGDVREGSEGDFKPTFYVTQRQDQWGGGSVMIRTAADPHALIPAVRQAMREVDPLLPLVNLGTFDEYRRRQLSPRRVPMQLMAGFSLAAIMLACIGVYGVGANAVALRRRELGIRMALGASRSGVLTLVMRDALRLIGGGVVAGVPLALLLSAQLRTQLYGVSPNDPIALAGSALLLAAVALTAALIPARRATRVDPIQVLRVE